MKLLYDATAFFQGVLDLQMHERTLTPEEFKGIEHTIRKELINELDIEDIHIRSVIVTNIRLKPKRIPK